MKNFYQKGFLWSLLLHGALISALLFTLPEVPSKQYVIKKGQSPLKAEIIKTSAIDGATIEAEISRIQTAKQQKQAEEKARTDALNKQAQLAKQNRIKEEQALKNLKAKQQQLLEKQQARIRSEQQKLVALKKEKAKERERLAQSKIKRKLLNDKIAKEKQARAEELKREKEQEEAKTKQLALEKKRREAQEAEAIQAKEREEKQQLVNAEVNRYKALLINAISQNWILPPNADKKLSCRFEIKLEPSGKVSDVTLLRSSGDPILDRSAQTAIYSASPLPVPSMPEAFEVFRVVSLTVKPENL